MRNRSSQPDSFDLFLDTICNTFGGVVFLAILLAVLIQNRTIVKSEQPTDKKPPSPDEVRSLITKLDNLSAEQASLQALIDSLPEKAMSGEDTDFVALTTTAESTESQLSEAITEQTKAIRELARQVEQNAEVAEQNAAVPEAAVQAQSKLRDAENAFKSLAESRQQALKLPRVQEASGRAMLILVKEQSLFVGVRPVIGELGFNKDQVSITELPADGYAVEPRRGRGWSLETSQGAVQFEKLLTEAKQNRWRIQIAIWPESYKAFTDLKDQLVTENVMYELWPQASFEPLIVYSGAGGGSVQ